MASGTRLGLTGPPVPSPDRQGEGTAGAYYARSRLSYMQTNDLVSVTDDVHCNRRLPRYFIDNHSSSGSTWQSVGGGFPQSSDCNLRRAGVLGAARRQMVN